MTSHFGSLENAQISKSLDLIAYARVRLQELMFFAQSNNDPHCFVPIGHSPLCLSACDVSDGGEMHRHNIK